MYPPARPAVRCPGWERAAERAPEAAHPGRLHHGLGDRLHRRHGRERGPAGDPRGPRRQPRGPAVDRRGLPADARLADPDRRLAQRPVRPAPGVRARHRAVRPDLVPVRDRTQLRAADRGARAAGDCRCAARAEHARHDRRGLPGGRARPRDRHVDRVERRLDRDRPAGRRRADRLRLLAVDLRAQPAAGRGDALSDRARRCPRASTSARRTGTSTCSARSCARSASPGPCSR